jgi:hypothetical protein
MRPEVRIVGLVDATDEPPGLHDAPPPFHSSLFSQSALISGKYAARTSSTSSLRENGSSEGTDWKRRGWKRCMEMFGGSLALWLGEEDQLHDQRARQAPAVA